MSPLSFVISYLEQHVRILKLYYSETRDTSHVQIGVEDADAEPPARLACADAVVGGGGGLLLASLSGHEELSNFSARGRTEERHVVPRRWRPPGRRRSDPPSRPGPAAIQRDTLTLRCMPAALLEQPSCFVFK